jgi:hypothetical protein
MKMRQIDDSRPYCWSWSSTDTAVKRNKSILSNAYFYERKLS